MHSVLHGEFDHVSPGEADGVLRRVLLAGTVVEGSYAQQRRHVGDPQNVALFGLRAAGADARLRAQQRQT